MDQPVLLQSSFRGAPRAFMPGRNERRTLCCARLCPYHPLAGERFCVGTPKPTPVSRVKLASTNLGDGLALQALRRPRFAVYPATLELRAGLPLSRTSFRL